VAHGVALAISPSQSLKVVTTLQTTIHAASRMPFNPSSQDSHPFLATRATPMRSRQRGFRPICNAITALRPNRVIWILFRQAESLFQDPPFGGRQIEQDAGILSACFDKVDAGPK
jgi:hypothetical protein